MISFLRAVDVRDVSAAEIARRAPNELIADGARNPVDLYLNVWASAHPAPTAATKPTSKARPLSMRM
jgi:hypothetical protein